MSNLNKMAFVKFLAKSCGFVGYFVQTVCITHCAFEYVGDFVMVSSLVIMIMIIIYVFIGYLQTL